MSKNLLESIWQAWHFSDNSQQTQDSGWLFKVWPLYEYFLQKFRSVYSPKQELSLDEAMIPWQGCLKFRTCNPSGRVERLVYEAVSDTGCHRRNRPNFGRVFLMLNYTDITQYTYIQSWTVTEIMAREVWKYGSCYTLTDCQIRIETGRNMWFL